MFIDEKAKERYASFIQEFATLSDSEKLSLIAYLILLYSEDMFFHPPIIDIINSSKILMNAVECGVDDLVLETNEKELYRGADAKSIFSSDREEAYNLRLFKDAPNLLSYEYRVIM